MQSGGRFVVKRTSKTLQFYIVQCLQLCYGPFSLNERLDYAECVKSQKEKIGFDFERPPPQLKMAIFKVK